MPRKASGIELSINEVIRHCEEKIKYYDSYLDMDKIICELGKKHDFVKEYLEHKQVAEWLKELKHLRGAMERIIERLEGLRAKPTETVYDTILVGSVIEIIKEEGGIE